MPGRRTSRRRHISAKGRAAMSAARRGRHHPHRGHRMSAAARAKISAALRGRKHPHRGHKLSAAAKAKISAKLKGRSHRGRTGRRTGHVTHHTRLPVRHRRTRAFRVSTQRIKVGAFRGFFRRTERVSARHHRIMRRGYRVLQRSYIKKRRR